MQVRDVMQAEARTCRPETDLAEVGRRMAEIDCGVLPVVDAAKRVVGMITDRDAFLALANGDRPPSSVRVQELLSGNVFCCAVDDPLEEALATMREFRVRRLPVVNAGQRVRGILSIDAVVLALRPATGETSLAEQVAETLRAINAPALPVPAG